LKARLAELREGSVVLYGVLDSDVSGLQLSGETGFQTVRTASNVPVFGPFDDLLGLGIVGGRLMQLSQIGREVAVVAERVLRERPTDVILAQLDLSDPVYDGRELKAWNIDLDRLPPGSAIWFQPVSPWKQYSGWITLAVLIMLAQFLLVSALLIQRRRRRLAEQKSSNLSRRLISAHEDEYRRVARELHDDVSQRLARLSIDAGYLVSHQGSESANEVLREMWPELVRVSKDIHDMSYRLHPSLVDDLGIAAALHAECERIRQRSGISILETISNFGKRLPHDTALCIYRIAQEAMSNAIKHAEAEVIEIRLEPVDANLMLTVRDNGVGFDPTSASAAHGLGLSSMNERAQLANGSLTIRSRPGHGTTVIASVPLMGAES
jgi:signal transduction histidine kinase